MTEELITVLSQLQGLRVIALTSAQHYTGKDKRVSQIAVASTVSRLNGGAVNLIHKDKCRAETPSTLNCHPKKRRV